MLVFHRQKSGWPSDATTIETWPWRWITETWQREVASKCVPLAVTVACEGWSLVSGLIVCQGTVLFKSKLYEIQLNMSQMRCCFHYVDLGSAWLPTIIHVVGSNTQRWTVRLCDATVGVSPFSGGSWELRKTWQRVLCEECSSFCSFVFSCLFFYSIIVLMLLFVCSCLLVYVYCSFIVVCFFHVCFSFFPYFTNSFLFHVSGKFEVDNPLSFWANGFGETLGLGQKRTRMSVVYLDGTNVFWSEESHCGKDV